MIGVLAAVVFAAAQAASPSPSALSPDWIAAPLGVGEYAHYTRAGSSRTADALMASRAACGDCRPATFTNELSSKLGSLDGASVRNDKATVCGASAEHVLITGIADTARRNVDVYTFRAGDTLVLIALYFNEDEPSAQDDAALRSLCPPAAPTA